MSMCDAAQDIELKQWELNNASRPAPVKYAPGDEGYGPSTCVRCDEDMPAARRAHGFTICVSCKEIEESMEGRRR